MGDLSKSIIDVAKAAAKNPVVTHVAAGLTGVIVGEKLRPIERTERLINSAKCAVNDSLEKGKNVRAAKRAAAEEAKKASNSAKAESPE